MRLVRAGEMKQLDQMAIQELGIPGVVLMENAGRGATRIFLEHFSPSLLSNVLIFCGPGNNGGDGYVMARYLREMEMKPTVMVLSKLEKVSGDALTNLKIIRRMKIQIHEVPGEKEWNNHRTCLTAADYIIDGILGTGLNSPVKGFYANVIENVNSSGKPVMAIDIPSGLNADTGKVMGVSIKADLTVTFELPKVGQVVFPGVDLVGRLVRIHIGIPQNLSKQIPTNLLYTEPHHFQEKLSSEKADIHKGHRGHLLVLAGSTGKTGAAALAATGALRAGAGLVTLGIPQGLNPILEEKLTEAMTVPLADTEDGTLSFRAKETIWELMKDKTALAIGPGLSTHPETVKLVREIMTSCPLPMVVDADGINALAGKLDILTYCQGKVILTPHPGEMARLTGLKSADIQNDRIEKAVQFVKKHHCCLVLKGARSLIVNPSGEVYINPTGNPALSSGGSGDVLTGLIGGFLARGWPLNEAAISGTYLHGLAADLLAQKMGSTGVLASELPTVIPELMINLSRGLWPLENRPPHADFYQVL